MTRRRTLEGSAYVLGLMILFYVWLEVVPTQPFTDLSNPAQFATLGGVLAAAGILLYRLFLVGHLRLERLLLASVLGFMPLIYIWAAALSGDKVRIVIECLGLVVFGCIAVIGYLRSSLLLGIGIAAHGIGWDSWHHSHASFIASWYPFGCHLFDVAFGIMIVAYVLAPNHERPGTQVTK